MSTRDKAGKIHDEQCGVFFRTKTGKWDGWTWTELISDEEILNQFIELVWRT